MPKRRSHNTGSVVKHGSRYRAAYCVTRNGKRVRGSKLFDLKHHAEAWLREQLGNGPASSDTLGEWLEQWLALHASAAAASTLRRDRQCVVKYLQPRLGHFRLRDLAPLRVREFFATMRTDEVSDSERNRVGQTLRKSLNAAVANGLLTTSPMSRIKLPSVSREEMRVLTIPQLLHLQATATRLGYPFGVSLQADACLRPGELLGLKWGDVDLETGVLSVRRSVCVVTGRLKDLKTRGSRRSFPLSAPVLDLLRLHHVADPNQALIPHDATETGHYRYAAWSNGMFRRIADAAGLPWATGYTLRHTGASMLLSLGANIYVVSRRLGHQKASTTLNHYTHLMPDDQQRAADLFAGIFGSLPTISPREDSQSS